MTKIGTIQNIAGHVGKEVTIQGWPYAKTGQDKNQALPVRGIFEVPITFSKQSY